MVSNGEVIHSGVIDGSRINAQVAPSDLQVVFALILMEQSSFRMLLDLLKTENM